MHSTTSILRIGVIHFRSGAIARLERAVHPPVPRGCMLSREVHSTFRALCYRKQRRHLARLKISERAARKRVLMPDVTQAGVELSVEPAEQISHLPKRETLAIFLTHRAKIQRALAAGIRNQYAGLAILIESRRIGVLNRQIAQPVTA